MLKATLGTVSLTGLVQLLATEEGTGRLEVCAAAPERRALLWMARGRLVHAELHGLSAGAPTAPEDALSEALGFTEGDLAWTPGLAAPARTLHGSTEHLLMEAACRRDHSRRDGDEPADARSVPSLAPVPEGAATPRFNTLEWRLLALVDGRRDVAALAARVGMPVEAVLATLGPLRAAGVLRLR